MQQNNQTPTTADKLDESFLGALAAELPFWLEEHFEMAMIDNLNSPLWQLVQAARELGQHEGRQS